MNMLILPLVTKSKLIHDLRQFGIGPGQTVMLHASVRNVGWIVGGPDVILQAILEALGPTGTLMMYISWEEWERALLFRIKHLPKEQQQAYLAECPPFDPVTSRANWQWSILGEYLRTWPGAYRSHHPTASVTAVGSQADWLTQDHPINYGYGEGSPFAKFYEANGRVLLLGSPLKSITLLHYAEHRAAVEGKPVVRNRVPVLQNGQRVWVECEQFDTSHGIQGQSAGRYFEAIARQYLASGKGLIGKIGAAQSYLFEAPDLVNFAVQWLEDKFSRSANQP